MLARIQTQVQVEALYPSSKLGTGCPWAHTAYLFIYLFIIFPQ